MTVSMLSVSGLEKSQGWSDDEPMLDEIRQILKDHGRLPIDVDTLADDADLYQAGMASHASIEVMLALENRFDVEFPDHMLTRSVFESISSIAAALRELRSQAALS